MKIRIFLDCEDCDGHGIVEVRASGVGASGPWVEYNERNCEECGSTGKIHHDEFYDSIFDASNDYPKALRFEYLEEIGEAK